MNDETQTPESPQEPRNDRQPAAAGADPTAAQLPDLEPTRDAVALDNLELILDVTVTVSVQVGSTHIPIRQLLQMNQGSILELDQPAGMPMDVLVNGTPIAHGEVVMVNDRVGIRLTDVISPRDRIRSIN